MNMLKKRNQKGFTLIEIIAVLVILGILAAVAIPKYMDLQNDANTRALQGAAAEGLSTASMQFARLAMSVGGQPTAVQVASGANANKPGSNDFTYVFSDSGSTVNVVVDWNPAKSGISSITRAWVMP
jgi:MSHA pilin protein MshA